MSLFSRRLKYVTCRTWDATADRFAWPELHDQELKQPGLAARPNTGLAFSGGGNRSASATLGQLRALTGLLLLPRVRYISCVSGGAWACAPFTWLPETLTDETFLGPGLGPAQLTPEALRVTAPNSLAHAIANSVLLDDFLKSALWLAGDETFSRAIGRLYLDAFGISSMERFFSLHEAAIQAILGRNPAMRRDDFTAARRDRPFLIVGATILRTDNPPPKPQKIHFESTPLYVGAKALHPDAGSNGRPIGGGYVEPFGFDSDAPEAPPGAKGAVSVRLGAGRYRYTLSDALGASSAAPAQTLGRLGLDFVGFPEFKVWPLANIGKVRAREYEFGDGGDLENLGIMPLLARRVERIVVFVNTKDALLVQGGRVNINDSIPPLFGRTPGFMLNHVFPEAQYMPLVEGLWANRQAGRSVLFRDRYPVRDNPHYGIEGGWEAEVLWVYNERV
nr:patatin-like phospholipase family protein [Pseudomonadota bacterium]